MALAVIGLSHRTAPVEVRERFVFNDAEAAAGLLQLTGHGGIREAVLLSTCNRTELYLVGDRGPADGPAQSGGGHRNGGGTNGAGASSGVEDPMFRAAERLLAERAGLTVADAATHMYRLRRVEAARHLFRVVTSLDSMVVGEAQIQGQVKRAYESAAALGGDRRVVGPVLARLFESALRVGGRVRSETALGLGAASVPSAAIELSKKIFGTLRGRRALVLGAGEMSALAAECLAAEGVESIVVANRTEERAEQLAVRAGASAASYSALPELLPKTDIIATATAAPHPVITRDLVQRALPSGANRPLLIVDIALPRDVEPAVGELENVFLYDIDDLNQIVDDNLVRRRAAIDPAERIIADEAAAFWNWYTSLEVVPVIRALRDRAESVRRLELEKALKQLDQLTPEQRTAVEALTRQLLNKVLHPPTVRLREAANNGRGVAIVDAARYLFDLDAPVDE